MEEFPAQILISGESSTGRITSQVRPNAVSVEDCMKGYAQLDVVECSYMWTIYNFNLRPEEIGEELESPTFTARNDDQFKWRLEIYPKGKNGATEGYISLYVRLASSNENEVPAMFKVCILNKEMEETYIKKSSCARRFYQTPGKGWGWDTFIATNILFDDTKGLLIGDKLILYCEIRAIIADSASVSDESSTAHVQVAECSLSMDLGLIFENQKFSDVILSVAGKEINAHKAILAGRSSVFQAMFEHEMEEKKRNRVDIADVDLEVFQEMLRFIYTGKVSKLESLAADLLAAADKYDLQRLKAMCEEALCINNLTIENASAVLVLADMHGANQLKTQAIHFINMHTTEVMKTAGWRSMVQSHPHIMVDLYQASATRQILPKL